ncbi:hypothetical protein LCGC14_2827380 [marine sediment metagenome]|uniref:Uncharacterized protein n=1 Tax=marine sediment metagenome TaxID=412755 RepID=A0A0F8Z1W2_9ZZZZ
MIKIEFTCYSCGESSEIGADDIDEKDIVPVCDGCYGKFLSRKERLVKSSTKKLISIYNDYGIPGDTFKADEEFNLT